ncbi:diadenylate cyclase CdaA [Scatolibacter rhodanostii]|uniref:diadenylate cyclase CdaA n=1 Tax=Scatolibacter rhodanostii TaxID=2014781 RepID=UPI000C07E242|nr:diadenylate cyclase CdaA [Scatolibacter rhodanostii]
MDTLGAQLAQFGQVLINIARGFQWKDALDIGLVAALLYQLIKLMRDSRAGQLLKGVVLVFLARIISSYFKLLLLSRIMDFFFEFGFISVIILFQPEIRKALEKVGRSNVRRSVLGVFFGNKDGRDYSARMLEAIDAVVEGTAMLQQLRMGALIVFERETRLDEIAATGTIIDAKPNAQMIGNVFYNKAPLHDGALLIRNGKLYAAGCILPLTNSHKVSASLGTRHRAAMGISEDSDAVVVVVSEETGQISFADAGRLERNLTRLQLNDLLKKYLIFNNEDRISVSPSAVFGRMKISSKKKGAEKK